MDLLPQTIKEERPDNATISSSATNGASSTTIPTASTSRFAIFCSANVLECLVSGIIPAADSLLARRVNDEFAANAVHRERSRNSASWSGGLLLAGFEDAGCDYFAANSRFSSSSSTVQLSAPFRVAIEDEEAGIGKVGTNW